MTTLGMHRPRPNMQSPAGAMRSFPHVSRHARNSKRNLIFMIRVLVADDHPIVRRGLVQIFESVADIRVADEAADAAETLAKCATGRFHVVLLDLNMPGAQETEIIKQIRDLSPPPAVLVLSVHPEERYGLRALKAGAAGYVTKDAAPEQLQEAIRLVHKGRRYITPTLAQLLAEDLGRTTSAPPHELLSDREFMVMRMLAKGLSVSAIATELSLSVKTVSTYRTRLLRKMHMKNNAELTRYAIRHCLVD